jgi:hypothetical protein
MLAKINAFRGKVNAVHANVRTFTAQLDRTLQRLSDVAAQHQREELIARQVRGCLPSSIPQFLSPSPHSPSAFHHPPSLSAFHYAPFLYFFGDSRVLALECACCRSVASRVLMSVY